MARGGFGAGGISSEQSADLATALNAAAIYKPSDFDNPVTADAAINSLAPVEVDSVNTALLNRTFDAATAEGVLLPVQHIPAGVTSMILEWRYRGSLSSAGAQVVKMDIYEREDPTGAAVTAWSAAIALADITIPTNNILLATQTQTIALSAIGAAAGQSHQFELARKAADAGDTYAGDLLLRTLSVRYA